MMKMQKVLRYFLNKKKKREIYNIYYRQESEKIVMLKGKCPDNKIPKGLLLDSNAISDGNEYK